MLEKVTRSGVTEFRHLIAGGSSTVIYTRRDNGTTATTYVTSDHLGSGDLLMDGAATVLARESFAPFGARRGSNWQGTPTAADYAAFAATTRRGFTGHEMLDNVQLIHMKGRVYDPALGRFLSVDPLLDNPGMPQSLNAYGYCVDNPVSCTDPSGYFSLGKLIKTAVTIAVAYYTRGLVAGSSWATCTASGAAWGGVASTAAGGFAGNFVASGGNLNSAMQGGVSGVLFYGAGSFSDAMQWEAGSVGRAISHAAAGCLGSAGSGGSCSSGGLSAGFAEFAGPKLSFQSDAANLMARSVLGGSASVLGGGKFGDGAMTGAYGYLFNHVAHNGFTLRNPNVLRNLDAINKNLVDMGYDDAEFELSVTGGDRYRDSDGNIRSATNGSIVKDASERSPHLYERGARAVDLDVRGVSNADFDAALRSTQFDPYSTVRDYPNAPHTHINLFNRKNLYFSPSD